MPEMSGPWEIPPASATLVGDQTRNGFGEQDWRRMMRALQDGVLPGSGAPGQLPLEVYATGNDRVLRVRPGRALVQGALYVGTAVTGQDYVATFTVPTSGANFYRVCLLYDPTAKTVRLQLRTATSAVAITQQEDGLWAMPLGTVQTGTGAITNEMIGDDRRTRGDVLRQYRSLFYPAPGLTPQTIPNDGSFVTVGGWGYNSGDIGVVNDRDADGINYQNGVLTLKADGLYTATYQLTFNGVNNGSRAAALLDQAGIVISRGLFTAATTGQGSATAYAYMPPTFMSAGAQVRLTAAVQATASGPVQLSALAGANQFSIQRVGSPR